MKPIIKIKQDAVKTIIKTAEDKMFSVVFIKKDKSRREMNCRFKVKKHLKGGKKTTGHIPNLMTVYDLKAEGYRCINTDTVREIKVRKNHYVVV